MQTLKSTLLPQRTTLLNSYYHTPRQYIDCQKLVQQRLSTNDKNKSKEISNDEKIHKFKKKFFLDQTVKSFKANPSPNKYVEQYSTFGRYKSQSTFITKSKEFQQKLGKRPTWIQDIEKYQQKYHPPAVGKYNLLTKSDFSNKKKSESLQKILKKSTKFNYLDDFACNSSKVPGPGSHNPHKQIEKLKVNLMNCKSWKKKHEQEDKKLKKKLNSSNISSCSYSPVKDKTFQSISKQTKRVATLMKVPSIDKKSGRNSLMSCPGPGAHETLNKWGNQTFFRERLIGKLHIFEKTTRSFPILKVYH